MRCRPKITNGAAAAMMYCRCAPPSRLKKSVKAKSAAYSAPTSNSPPAISLMRWANGTMSAVATNARLT